MASASDVLKQIKDESIEWVDLRFTDPKGKWQHLTMVAGILTEDELEWMRVVSETHQEFIKALLPSGENHAE